MTAYNSTTFPDYRSCGRPLSIKSLATTSNVTKDMRHFFCEPCAGSCFWKKSVWSPPFPLVDQNAVKKISLRRSIVLLGDSTVRDLFWILYELITGTKHHETKCVSHSARRQFCDFSEVLSPSVNLSFSFLDGSNITNELANLGKFYNSHVFLHCPIFGSMKTNVYDRTLTNTVRHRVNNAFNRTEYAEHCRSYFHSLQQKNNYMTILGQTPLPSWTRSFSETINFDVHRTLDSTFKLCQRGSQVDVIDRYGVVMSKTRDCIHPTRMANTAIARMVAQSAMFK